MVFSIKLNKEQLLVLIATSLYIMNVGVLIIGLQIYFIGKVSDFQIALLSSVYWIPIIFLSPFWGYIADVTGKMKEIAVANLVGMAITIYLHTIFSDYTGIFILRIITGVFSSSYAPTIQAYITHKVRPEVFGRNLAIYNTGIAIGFLISGYMTSLIIIYLTIIYIFYVPTVSSLLSAIFIALLPSKEIEPRKITIKSAIRAAIPISVALQLKRGRAIFLTIALAVRHIAIMGFFSLVYVYMQKVGIPSKNLGFLATFNNIMQIILIPIFGIVADNIGRKKTFIPGFILSMCIPIFFMKARTNLEFAIGFAFIGIGYSMLIAGANAYLRDVAPKGKEGEVLSLVNITRGVGMIIGPIVVGSIVAYYSYQVMFEVLVIIGMFATILAVACEEIYKKQPI